MLDYQGLRLIWQTVIILNSLVRFFKTTIVKPLDRPVWGQADSQPTSSGTFSKMLNQRCLFLITKHNFPLGNLLGCLEFVISLKHCHF